MSFPLVIFDIETVPCLETARAMYPEIGLITDDVEAINALKLIREKETGREFLRLPMQKVICISFVWVENGTPLIRTLKGDDEKHLLSTFVRMFEKKPIIGGWNTQGFDLPVLLYRMAKHGINANAIFGFGNKNQDYTHKFCDRHIDLMDKFSFGQYGNKQSLDCMASLLGFAGKGDITGADVLALHQAGEWDKIAIYCESDVINTYLVYLAWLRLSGQAGVVNADQDQAKFLDVVRAMKNADGTPRHSNF